MFLEDWPHPGSHLAVRIVICATESKSVNLWREASHEQQSRLGGDRSGLGSTPAALAAANGLMAGGDCAGVARSSVLPFTQKTRCRQHTEHRPPPGGFFTLGGKYGRSTATGYSWREGGESKPKQPTVAPDSLRSIAVAQMLIAVGEGEFEGMPMDQPTAQGTGRLRHSTGQYASSSPMQVLICAAWISLKALPS